MKSAMAAQGHYGQGFFFFLAIVEISAAMYDSTETLISLPTTTKCGTVTHIQSQQLEGKINTTIISKCYQRIYSILLQTRLVLPNGSYLKKQFLCSKVAECSTVVHNAAYHYSRATENFLEFSSNRSHVKFRKDI